MGYGSRPHCSHVTRTLHRCSCSYVHTRLGRYCSIMVQSSSRQCYSHVCVADYTHYSTEWCSYPKYNNAWHAGSSRCMRCTRRLTVAAGLPNTVSRDSLAVSGFLTSSRRAADAPRQWCKPRGPLCSPHAQCGCSRYPSKPLPALPTLGLGVCSGLRHDAKDSIVGCCNKCLSSNAPRYEACRQKKRLAGEKGGQATRCYYWYNGVHAKRCRCKNWMLHRIQCLP